MKIALKYILLSYLFFLLCCQKEQVKPITDFEIIDYNVYKEQYFIGVPIIFSNKSEYSNSYIWDFGDGTQSNDTCPKHVYKAPGIYKVELTAKNKDFEVQKSINIIVRSDRFALLTNVKRWRLIGKKQLGQKVELTTCDRNLRLRLTKNLEYIIESANSTICNFTYKENWYLGSGNTIYESAGMGSWYGHDFYLTDKILILKMPQQYEFIYEPE